MKFTNKTALVTGAGNGIGRATALDLARDGANLVLCDIQEENLKQVAKEVQALGAKVSIYTCDVSNEQRVQEIVNSAISKYGKIDILVNNAGIFRCNIMPFAESESSMWKQKIEVNILGTMYFTRAVLPCMIENRYGKIVNVSSVAGTYGIRNMVDYSMTKGAINSFNLALAKEVSEYGINVNGVLPGNIDSDYSHPEDNGLSFIQRPGLPDEVAKVICFLCSDDASYVAGQNYQVDGCRKKM